MAASKILHGGRIMVAVSGKIIGWFDNASWSVTYDATPAYILGRMGPAEIPYVAVEPVSGQLGGWRTLGHGPYAELGMPQFQDLLTADTTTITLFDRATNTRVGAITDVRLLGFQGAAQARQLEQQTVPYIGMLWKDETAVNSESGTAVNLP